MRLIKLTIPYIITVIIYRLIFDSVEDAYSIIINPFIFYGLSYIVLNHLRYLNLTKICKNYTLKEFIVVYKKCSDFAYSENVIYSDTLYETIYYDRKTIEKYRPLAKSMLSISKSYTPILFDEPKNRKELEKFIKNEYISKLFSVEKIVILFLAIITQLRFWGIIEVF